MSMMYKIVAEALEKEGLSEVHHPQDYLNFYCLGKREVPCLDSIPQADIPCEGRYLVLYFPTFRNYLIRYLHPHNINVKM